MIYNEFCESKNCKGYIEWEYQFESDMQPYPCVSCKLIGQSHDIIEYPKDCPFLNEIKDYGIDLIVAGKRE